MNDKHPTCRIWGTLCNKIEVVYRQGPASLVDSPRAGGKYILADPTTDKMHTTFDELSKVKLSRWIYEQNQREGEPPKIDRDTLEKETTRPMPSALEQMDYCLQFLKSKEEAVGGAIDIASCSDEIQAATLLKNESEIRPLIEAIGDEDWIKIQPDAVSDIGVVVIRRKGYQRLEELKKTNAASE